MEENHALNNADDDTHNQFPTRTSQEAKTRERIRILTRALKPVPFRPTKALDFARHETLLRRIGLWEFAHVEFDRSIRVDLVAQLIGSFAPALRCGYVNGVRVLANRVQLGRVLKLPLMEKKKKGETLEGGALEGLNFAESIGFVEEFVRNWVVLHDDHDVCDMIMMPSEVLQCRRLIREGRLEKVDWGGLVWTMVEREMRDPGVVKCHYASHLQLLIRLQHEELLQDVPLVVLEDEDEGSGDVRMAELLQGEGIEEGVHKLDFEEVEAEPLPGMMNSNVGEPCFLPHCDVNVLVVDGGGDMRMGEVGESEELNNIELSLGGGDDFSGQFGLQGEEVGCEKQMDLEESKGEPPAFDLNDSVGDPFLHQSDVNLNDFDNRQEQEDEELEEEEDEEEEEEEDEEEEDDDDDEIPVEGMNEDRHHAMQAVETPFRPVIDLNDDCVGDFISHQDNPQMISGPSSCFGNGHTYRRDIGMDHHSTLPSLNGNNKRPRLHNPNNAEPSDFDICMNQIQHWMAKARSIYAIKFQSCEESTVNEQLLLDELSHRDSMINQLRKELHDESQKGRRDVYRLEKELHMMGKLADGYREGLRGTQKAFDEYKARCQQANEPYYKDAAAGSKGFVMEKKQPQLKQQQEEKMKCLVIEKHFRDFEKSWMGKLQVQLSRVESYGDRLLCVEGKVKVLQEWNVELKFSSNPSNGARSSY